MWLQKHILVGTVALFVGWFGVEVALRCTPLPHALSTLPPQSAEFVDREGRPLRRVLQDQRVYRSRCRLNDISPNAIAATLSAEDKRFRAHSGIDFLAAARALAQFLATGVTHSGASTISEQLVKLGEHRETRTVIAKVAEVWIALCLERRWTKDQILEEYLNRLNYGDLQVGLSAASWDYFEKPPSDLSVAEAAFLAAIPQAPSRLDPFKKFNSARARQLWVLGRMHSNGYLDDATYRRALSEPLRLRRRNRDFEAPFLVDLLLERRGTLPPEGGSVRTTIDLSLNQWIDQVIARQLNTLADKNVSAAAVTVIDNSSGDVLALCGSGNYFEPGIGQINGTWSARSAGSALKPFTYVRALENGAFPGTVVADVPTDFATETGLYHPNNYNHRFYGPVSLRFALANSLNVAAIKVLEQAGGPQVLYETLRSAGIATLEHPAAYYGLGLTIGNGEVRLLELTNAFASLARLGIYRPFHLLLRSRDDSGECGASGHRIFDQRAAYLLADILSDNHARAATFGLNSYLSFDFPVACKTGTSSNYRDNWTIGFTPEWTVGVWVGNPDNSAMQGITGVTGAAPIFREIMLHLHEKYGTSWYRPPTGIGRCWIDPLTGREVAKDHARATQEIFAFRPEPARLEDYDFASHVRLPGEYNAWLLSNQNTSIPLLPSPANHLRILQPAPGSFYFLDSDIPRSDQRLVLRAESSGSLEWKSASLDCRVVEGKTTVMLQEGRHEITARDKTTGETASTWIEVQPW
ncbi:MAG TPA: penicillin-binding protein 1C [Chthoniobacterales bacterium]|nr:penicillin-binding protein 1C [Chthoniobacterales bacterium]